jgi:hypothetical protein
VRIVPFAEKAQLTGIKPDNVHFTALDPGSMGVGTTEGTQHPDSFFGFADLLAHHRFRKLWIVCAGKSHRDRRVISLFRRHFRRDLFDRRVGQSTLRFDSSPIRFDAQGAG